jgi:hypothetical protein
MAKKLKFVSEERFEVYQKMSEDELVESLKIQHAFLEEREKEKKESGILKECRSEINEFRKIWAKKNPEEVEEMERLKEQIDAIKEVRDKDIEDALDEKKDLEAGFNEAINGAKEHVHCLVHCLRFHQ